MTGMTRRTGLFGLGRPQAANQTDPDDHETETETAEDEDGDDVKKPQSEDEPSDDDGDDQESDPAARKARAAERRRIGRILGSPHAVGRTALAAELACGTPLNSRQAVALLAAAPIAPGSSTRQPKGDRLDRAMAREAVPDLGPGGDPPAQADDGWSRAYAQAGAPDEKDRRR